MMRVTWTDKAGRRQVRRYLSIEGVRTAVEVLHGMGIGEVIVEGCAL